MGTHHRHHIPEGLTLSAMSDRRPPRSKPRDQSTRGGSTRGGGGGRPDEPRLPDDVAASDLDSEVRRDLLTLDKANAESVARHLVMVARLLDEDPELALAHARAARGRANRVGLVRETLGIAAYNAGEWQEALSELRAAKRISGSSVLLPLIADCERGLGRADRAVELARSEEGRALTGEEATEMRIVEAGARIDLGEAEKAVVTLESENLDPGQTGTAAARLFYAYASALAASGRRDDAITWFMNASAADVDDATDAEFRLVELADPDAPLTGAGNGDAADGTGLNGAGLEAGVSNGAGASLSGTAESSVPVSESVLGGYEALLLDLDGTVFAGRSPIPGAAETLGVVDLPQFFVTNNASRRPDAVAEHLRELGFTAKASQVVTSAQSGARLLSEHLEPGSRALVLGTDGLAQEVREVGIAVTRSASDRPAAVIQGFSPDIGWPELSEAVLAIRDGALWVATNVDATLPSERGQLIGNGSLVAAVANATGQQPLVAGKPAAPLMVDAISRSGVNNPLVVGDRLDTDIEGAHAVGLDSVLVLSGVSTVRDLLAAPPEQRPTFVVDDLRGLRAEASSARIVENDAWKVKVDAHVVSVESASEELPDFAGLLAALTAAVWKAEDAEPIDHEILRVQSSQPSIIEALVALGVAGVG